MKDAPRWLELLDDTYGIALQVLDNLEKPPAESRIGTLYLATTLEDIMDNLDSLRASIFEMLDEIAYEIKYQVRNYKGE